MPESARRRSLGSSTESADSSFDLLVAIPAPAKAPTFTGSYWTAALEFSGASGDNARNTFFSITPALPERLADFRVDGHAANIAGGQPSQQQITGATYLLNADGTGTTTFGSSSPAALLSGSRTLYVSASGNVILGGSTAVECTTF